MRSPHTALWLVVLLWMTSFALAQAPRERVDTEVINKIKERAEKLEGHGDDQLSDRRARAAADGFAADAGGRPSGRSSG